MTKRIIWADSLRGWLMILVIIGHAIQVVLGTACNSNHVWNLIYSFHMPAFIAISGWLAYKSSTQMNTIFLSAIKRRFYQLLIPYFIWSLIYFIFSGTYAFNRFCAIFIYPDSSFWFLWVLFWICVVFISCQWLAEKIKCDEIIPIMITCGVLMGIMVKLEFRMFGFQFIAYYFFFYSLGYCIHKFERIQISNKFVLGALTVVWGLFAWFWNMHELPSWIPAISHAPFLLMQYVYRAFTAFVAILLLLGGAPQLLNSEIMPNKWISQVGVISLGLYVVHLSFIGQIFSLIRTLIPNVDTILTIVLTFILSFISSYVIVKLLTLNKWTVKFLLGKI